MAISLLIWVLLLANYWSGLTAMIYGLLPVFFALIMISLLFAMVKMLKGSLGGRRRLRALVPFLLLFGMLSAGIFISPVAATASVSPGSTTTMLGMPVEEDVVGLTASTSYDVVQVSPTSGNTTIANGVYSDSAGALAVWCAPIDVGSSLYAVQLHTGNKAAVVTWTINNLDIMSMILPIVYLGVIITVIGALLGLVAKLRG
jgi:hypothetical protein